MRYVSYEFYTGVWGGKITGETFPQHAVRAEYILDHLTKGRIPLIWEELEEGAKDAVRMAVCTLVDGYAAVKTQDAEKISETVGKHSVTYATTSQSKSNRMRNAIRPYLDGITCNGVGLLYRGLEEDCHHACRR